MKNLFKIILLLVSINSCATLNNYPKDTIVSAKGNLIVYEKHLITECEYMYYLHDDTNKGVLLFTLVNYQIGDTVQLYNKRNDERIHPPLPIFD
jgi:hypothetical protein